MGKTIPERSARASPPSPCCRPINSTQKEAKAWRRVANEILTSHTKGGPNQVSSLLGFNSVQLKHQLVWFPQVQKHESPQTPSVEFEIFIESNNQSFTSLLAALSCGLPNEIIAQLQCHSCSRLLRNRRGGGGDTVACSGDALVLFTHKKK